ncbi:bifunctional 2-polyprenyl-6-hydroxyphenol methylase/3-demethylubiquinol 3-O-methyltransferase UbiG [Cyanobium sp. Copco_Reservoir_LC18]|uniref:bifunctional 2-polyprenyl-6-hydroxyphenol methylase/3-demethylubiquinol 3-O-methyltransferase UbiG n=1 Tax=Cyanobium sp. Copco_Reservoir_LC18 TaxID=1328305 RepID=UPI001F28A166|nr:bifunctional 2-polyprenyl-6-hydroxyphenol methylase/3-demethylubiquinol 3-O-methyltransferase UbiG [Cyanobium sp. Copco_Reservoir_LC18]
MIETDLGVTLLRNNLAFYDQQAASWWEPSATIFPLSRLNPPRFLFFDQFITHWENRRVLDVGCGGGYTCEFLARRGAVVTGIDRSAACIAAARSHAAASGLEITYRVGIAEELPFAAGSFDVVVCVDVLEHVDRPEAVVAEMGRVLTPGGSLCFDTINRTVRSRLTMIWLLETLLRLIPAGVHDWRRFVPPAELRRWLEASGFAAVTMRGLDLFGRGPLRTLGRLIHYRRTGGFQVGFDHDLAVMFIGVASLSPAADPPNR